MSDRVLGNAILVPACHVIAVCVQVCAGFVELIIELEIEVMSLQIDRCDQRRHSAGKLAEGVEHILGL